MKVRYMVIIYSASRLKGFWQHVFYIFFHLSLFISVLLLITASLWASQVHYTLKKTAAEPHLISQIPVLICRCMANVHAIFIVTCLFQISCRDYGTHAIYWLISVLFLAWTESGIRAQHTGSGSPVKTLLENVPLSSNVLYSWLCVQFDNAWMWTD